MHTIAYLTTRVLLMIVPVIAYAATKSLAWSGLFAAVATVLAIAASAEAHFEWEESLERVNDRCAPSPYVEQARKSIEQARERGDYDSTVDKTGAKGLDRDDWA